MKKIFIYLISLFLITSLYSSPVDSLWLQGNEAYSAGNFADASAKYESILKQGVESADIYFNLGNAYYKQNMLGQSILNYERALKLNPNNADISHNLEMARLTQLDKIEDIPEFIITKWYNSILQMASANTWGWISLFLFAVFLVFLFTYLFISSYRLRKMTFFIALLSFVLFITSIIFAAQQRANILDNSQAIIFSPVVTVKGSPDNNGTDLFVIHEGLKVRIIDQIGDWNRVVLSDGNQGWVPINCLEHI